ncbi:hypothetical protein DYB26_014500, partial [Aphanomyces astaci]
PPAAADARDPARRLISTYLDTLWLTVRNFRCPYGDGVPRKVVKSLAAQVDDVLRRIDLPYTSTKDPHLQRWTSNAAGGGMPVANDSRFVGVEETFQVGALRHAAALAEVDDTDKTSVSDPDEVASQRRLYRRHIDHTMHTIQEENGSDACGDCHAYLYRPDVIVAVTNVHMAPRRRPPFQNAERCTKASTTRAPTAAGMNSPTTRKAKKLPMQLNQLARPSKNAFANFPKRQSPRM